METEKEFFEKYKDLTRDQALELAYHMAVLQEQIKENYNSLARRLYGSKSEKVDPNQLSLFNEAELGAETASEEEKKEPTGEEAVPKKKKKSGKSRSRNVTVEVEHVYPANKTTSPNGGKLEELASFTVEYMEYRRAEYILHRYIVHNYTCKKENDETGKMVVYNGRDSLEPKLLNGSFVTPSLLANIVVSKFQLGVPLYRQEQYLARNGIIIHRQNMCRWMIEVSSLYLEFLYQKMIEDIRNCAIINCDETTLQCLEERAGGRTSSSYAWLVMSNQYEEKQLAVYYYDATREHKVLSKIIGSDYSGVIQSDGYGAYSSYPGTDRKAGCLSHARRKIYDALMSSNEALVKKYRKAGTAEKKQIIEDYPSFGMLMKAISLMDQLFNNERSYKERNLTPDQILEHRQKDDPEILDQLYHHVKDMEARFSPSGKAGTAITYILNQWEPLTYFMKDGRVPLTNNIAERDGIKPLVMSRKNFLFADTIEGAKSSMVWFSLIISAVMNGLNPEKYLNYVLEQAARHPMTDEMIQSLLPYSKNLPANLKSGTAR